jgi:hypothetical protein
MVSVIVLEQSPKEKTKCHSALMILIILWEDTRNNSYTQFCTHPIKIKDK